MFLPPGIDLLVPRLYPGQEGGHGIFPLIQLLHEFPQDVLHIADDGKIDPYILLDRCGVHIHMNDTRMGGKGGYFSGYPVIETGADRNKQVGIGHRHIGIIGAVHAKEPQRVGVVLGECAESHEGGRHRYGQPLRQLGQIFRCIGGDYPAANVNNRLA